VGKGARADCIREALRLADEYAVERFSMIDNAVDEIRTVNGAWRLALAALAR
jgi:hypothetical protein